MSFVITGLVPVIPMGKVRRFRQSPWPSPDQVRGRPWRLWERAHELCRNDS